MQNGGVFCLLVCRYFDDAEYCVKMIGEKQYMVYMRTLNTEMDCMEQA